MAKFNRIAIVFDNKSVMEDCVNFLMMKKLMKKNYNTFDKNDNPYIIIDSVLNSKELFNALKNKIGTKNFIIRKV
jgi:predicted AAA+ superfamily ATPase